jgi:hypothetical protein
MYALATSARRFNDDEMPDVAKLKNYGSAFDVPKACQSIRESDGSPSAMSVREMVVSGVFSPKGSGSSSNTLLPDWNTLFDAMRIDLSVKKAVNPTIRENIYRIHSMPNSSKIFNIDEFYPYAVTFAEHNGSGQAVKQGETRGGQTDTVEHKIYAAGFTYDLLAALFDRSLDFDKVNDAVIEGYNSKRDDLAIAPILAGSYAGAKTTAAATTSTFANATREELLYYTLENAIDAFMKKVDPLTGVRLSANGLVVLASETVAGRTARVCQEGIGVKKAGVSTDSGFPPLRQISRVLGYDGNTISGRMEETVYNGVGDTYAYLIMPCNGFTRNRYFNIGVKRNLTAEIDMTPDVKTLAREERAWYFVEGMAYAEGINSFVQRIELPTW